jgi:hypothetical protein
MKYLTARRHYREYVKKGLARGRRSELVGRGLVRSAAAGRERPVQSKKKLMNIEHRTSNIERRIMYSACRELLCRTIYVIKD